MKIISDILGDEKKVAFYGATNLDSVLFNIACIKLGLEVVYCNIKEPISKIENYLSSLNVKFLFISGDNFLETNLFNQYLIKEVYFLVNKNKSQNYFSNMQTSGSTGQPKNVRLSFLAHVSCAKSVCNYFSLSSKDRFLLNLPLYHVSGLSILFRSLVSGCSLFVASNYDEICFAINNKLVTHISLVPFLLNKLMTDNIDLSCLKAVFVGGDALNIDLTNKALSKKIKLFESYGLSEMASTVLIKNYNQAHSCFIALPYIDLKLENGELLVKNSYVMNDFVHTGDLFTYEQNKLKFMGRKSNLIISGGENICPEEIENIINSHEAVELSVVIPKTDILYGQRPIVFVKWIDKSYPNELLLFMKQRLASFKIPVEVLDWPTSAPLGNKMPRLWFLKYVNILYDSYVI